MGSRVYFVAASLDGFIADRAGSVAFLDAVQSPGEDFGYARFFANVGALIMGRRTYEFSLSLGEWPYGDRPCAVVSSRELKHAPPTVKHVRGGNLAAAVASVDPGERDLWVVGGGALAGALLERGLLDEVILSTIPVVLGGGAPLFATSPTAPAKAFTLVESRVMAKGLVQSRYRVG